jgi:type I restriction enzyme, S subunit
VSLESFFTNFALFFDAPHGITNLRKLILELAVRGKLVAQDRHDEPATTLANTIFEERLQLATQRGELRVKSARPIRQVEIPYTLPDSWVWQRLEEVFYPISPGRNKVKSSEVNKYGKFPVVDQGKNFVAGYVDDESKIIKIPGPVIVFGDHTCELKLVDFDFVAGADGVKILRPIQICEQYFFRVAQTFKVAERGYSRHYKFFLDNLFPLAPLEEQKRIVAKIDELMWLCDDLEAHQQARCNTRVRLNNVTLAPLNNAASLAPEELEQALRRLADTFDTLYDSAETVGKLRSTILQLAVQGKLVPQDPNEEPASTSVDLVSREARQAIQRGIIRRHGLIECSEETELTELPFGWRWTRLPEITRPVPYAIKRGPFGSAIRKDMFVSSGFKIYEQQHAISGDFTKGRYYITESKFKELSAFELHPNEVLVSCSGTIGKVAIVPPDIERGIINQALLKLSLHQSALLNEYFLILFPAFFMETETLTNLSGTAQKNIPGMDVLRAMPFPLPPLAEQRRIVDKVNQLMALCDELETKLRQAEADSEKLMNAAVHHVLICTTESMTV